MATDAANSVQMLQILKPFGGLKPHWRESLNVYWNRKFLNLHSPQSIMVRKVVVRRYSKVNRIMITERCTCGQMILKGMVKCPGRGKVQSRGS